jgi:dTDP-4-amino-4,6-dideoxygalactose transaminase
VRGAFQAHLAAAGIETLIHYPVPIPAQPAMSGVAPAECPIAARNCDEIVSLPLYPALPDQDARRVAEAVRAFAPRLQVS